MEEEEEEMKRPDAERQSLLTSGKYSIQEEDQEPDVEEDTQVGETKRRVSRYNNFR